MLTPAIRFSQADFAPATPPVVTPEPLTWAELVRIEPCLRNVEQYARSLPKPPDWPGWEEIKKRFLPLVGWFARRPALRTTRAYNAAYDHLLNVFDPECEL